MTAVKQQAFSMLQLLSDESVSYIIKILEGLQGLERQKAKAGVLEQRLSDIRNGVNCAEQGRVESFTMPYSPPLRACYT